MPIREIRSKDDMRDMVLEYGFMPILASPVPGFSIESHTAAEYWFIDGVDGPWEWKGPVIRETGSAYGKFFCGRAGFITREWYADFAACRRGGLDVDERYEAGLMRREDYLLYGILSEHGSLLAGEWRRLAGIRRRSAFDGAVARLQMMGYVTTIDFEYAVSAAGEPYGWGLARYMSADMHFGEEFSREVYNRTPEESYDRILSHLMSKLPDAPERLLRRVIE